MNIVEQEVIVLDELNGDEILQKIERIGRVCYKSEHKITDDSSKTFVANIIKRGHESVLEHVSITVFVRTDRGVSHEIVRHRIASYSQESTRYCNYSADKFGNSITFVKPVFWDNEIENFEDIYSDWKDSMSKTEEKYFDLLNHGALPQEARSVLPNSLKTDIVMTMNLREWRHFFRLRTAPAAHPQMRDIAFKILHFFKESIPIVFDEFEEE